MCAVAETAARACPPRPAALPHAMPAPVRTPDTAPPLIFAWKRERGVKRRLAMWILVVAAGHAALFYLFRVAPPLDSRKPPPQQAVLHLPAAEPGARALLSALSDRYPGAVLRSADHDLAADMAALAKATPPWEPMWSAHRAVLKPFPLPAVPQELPALLTPGAPLLPDDASAPLPPVPAKPAARPAPFVVTDTLAGGRAISQPPVWPDKLPEDTWPVSGTVPFMLGIHRTGRVEYCLPLSPATGLDLETLRRVLMGMKFTPATAGGLTWLNIAVRW